MASALQRIVSFLDFFVYTFTLTTDNLFMLYFYKYPNEISNTKITRFARNMVT